jgi:hypothetical protein
VALPLNSVVEDIEQMTAAFSRANPSSRYTELVTLYNKMHLEGEAQRNRPPEKVYPGDSLPVHALPIKVLIDATQSRTLLDYGAGKGLQYQWQNMKLTDGRTVPDFKTFWGLDSITCYDPAYPPFTTLPKGKFDGVVCTDVLEHCPESDVEWILDEIFGYARKFVYANIACHKAKATLPNGENAHCTARPQEWWQPLIERVAARHKGVRYRFVMENKKQFLFLKKRFRTYVAGQA